MSSVTRATATTTLSGAQPVSMLKKSKQKALELKNRVNTLVNGYKHIPSVLSITSLGSVRDYGTMSTRTERMSEEDQKAFSAFLKSPLGL